jgi:hypothetical protein
VAREPDGRTQPREARADDHYVHSHCLNAISA